jgi:hypothetical protein
MTRLALVIASPPPRPKFSVSCEYGQRGLAFSTRYAFQPRGDVDAIAHQVAVALLDDVT